LWKPQAFEFGQFAKFNQPVAFLSNCTKLESLKFGYLFNQRIRADFPCGNLKHLEFEDTFNQPVDFLSNCNKLKSLKFDYDFDKCLWKRQEDDGETQYFEIYFCRGPADTAYFCGVVCVRKNDEEDNQEEKKEYENDIVPTYAWFYTSRDVPTFSEPMQEGVFA